MSDRVATVPDAVQDTLRRLLQVWCEFESMLGTVPIIAKLERGRLRIEDYRRLLVNLRQQVVDGSRWIARAASNIGPEHEALRSMFLRHAVAEHQDYLMLERDFVACGGDLAEIRSAPKNIGSEAFSAWMFQAASQPSPLSLIGAMSIIEGLGARVADGWATRIREQLGLGEDAVTFLRHHGAADPAHMEAFEKALALALQAGASADQIVRNARIVARLYRLQLEEIDHV
jgi:pyrroloquinoline quinone (PQQ) biosynthesis protein C